MRAYTHYSEKFKRTIVQQVLDGKISKEEANRKYGIRGHSLLKLWIELNNASKHRAMKAKSTNNEPVKSLQELQAENRRLLQELDMEQLRNRALNVMIDIAEKQFNIPIRKKPGAKQ